jgi:hypothetical protein
MKLTAYCTELIDLVKLHLLPAANSASESVRYLTLSADAARWLAQWIDPVDRSSIIEKSQRDYESAIAFENELYYLDTDLLTAKMNFSCLLHDVKGEVQDGIAFAAQTYRKAYNSMGCDSWSERTLVFLMEMLKENVEIWLKEQGCPDNEEAKNLLGLC